MQQLQRRLVNSRYATYTIKVWLILTCITISITATSNNNSNNSNNSLPTGRNYSQNQSFLQKLESSQRFSAQNDTKEIQHNPYESQNTTPKPIKDTKTAEIEPQKPASSENETKESPISDSTEQNEQSAASAANDNTSSSEETQLSKEQPSEEQPSEETDSEQPSEEQPSEETDSEQPSDASSTGEINKDVDFEEMSTDDLLGMDLEGLLDLTVSIATKTEEKIEEAPAIVDVVSAKDIQRWGYRSVADTLRHIIGFYIIDDHTILNLAMRGVTEGLGGESGIIKVMVNGRSISYRTTSGNWLGVELIPINLVERIEVIRGPASSLYGANAFMGVVNIVTKEATNITNADIRIDQGFTDDNFGYYLEGSVATQIGKMDMLFGIATEKKDRAGLELPDSSPFAIIPGHNIDDNTGAVISKSSKSLEQHSLSFYGNLKYNISEDADISVYAHGSSLGRGGDFSRWSQLSYGYDQQGRLNQTWVDLNQYQVGATGQFKVGPVKLSVAGSYFTGGPSDDDRIEVASGLFYLKRETKFQGTESQIEAQWSPIDRLTIVSGAEFVFDREHLPPPVRVNKFTREEIIDQDTLEREEDQDLINPGAYLQAYLTIIEQYLKVTGGLRWDYHNIYGHKVTGRAALVSLPVKQFAIKALYGSAFKAPSPQLLYTYPSGPGDIIGNEKLKPQMVHTVEGQLSYKWKKNLVLTTDLAYNILLNKAEFVSQGINKTAHNLTSMKSLTWENLATFVYSDYLNAYVGYEKQLWIERSLGERGYQAGLVGDEGIVYPDWMLRVGTWGQIPTGEFPISLSSDIMIVGKRRASDTNILENGEAYDLPVYPLWNGSIGVTTNKFIADKQSSLHFKVYNILGTNGPDPGFSGFDLPLTAREVFLSFRQKL